MKHRLGRGPAIAAGAVAPSLFVLLCMMFYGKEDYLSPERILTRGDALRFRIASLFVQPFGAGAYLAFGLAFLWSVVVYFRESAGNAMPRIVGALACIPSFCALTALAGGRHEFWSGSVGIWAGDLVYRGFGPVMAWGVVGTLFLVSFALATQLGFYTQFATLRGSLAFPLLPPEEPAFAETASAVLEPGAAEPVEAWKSGGSELPLDLPPAADFAPSFVEELIPVEPVYPSEGLVPADLDDFSDASLLNRDEHVADVRQRLAAGEPVTEAERKLVSEAKEQAEMAFAIDALFEEPGTAAPEATPAAALPSLAMPDLPPFLVAPSAHPLLSQEIVVEGPALPPAASAAPPAPPAPAPEAARGPRPKIETEEYAEAEGPVVVQDRAPYIFAAVEFLPPNEELADPAFAPSSPEIPEAGLEADGATAGKPADAPVLPTEGAVEVPAPGSAPASAGPSTTFEDEVFSFGFEVESPASIPEEPSPIAAPEVSPSTPEGGHAEASALVMASPVGEPAPASVPEGVFAMPVPPALALSPVEGLAPVEGPAAAPVEEAHAAAADAVFPDAAQDPVVEDSIVEDSWLLAAAQDLGLESIPAEDHPAEIPAVEPAEPIAAPIPFIEPDPSVEVFPAESLPMTGQAGADAALAALFGAPVARTDAPVEAIPPGPAQQEPREPPANLMPLLDKVEEHVTLLNDPDLGDCLKDHGITVDLHDEVVVVSPGIVVEDDGPPAEKAPEEEGQGCEIQERGISSEEAADAIVNSFGELFGEAAETLEAPKPEVEALAAHGWGTLFPAMLPGGTEGGTPAAESAPAAEASTIPETGPRVPVHAPPPVEASEIPIPAEPASVEIAPAPVEEEEASPAVDEALVSRLVEDFKSEPEAVPAEEAPVAAEPPASEPEEAAPPPARREDRDELYDQAIAAVKERGRGSVVVLQRKLSIGFTRATRILEQLVADGVVGPENASGSHPVL